MKQQLTVTDYAQGVRRGDRAMLGRAITLVESNRRDHQRMAQELLTTFEEELTEVALVPSKQGGTYRILLDGHSIFDRATAERFPEAKEIKQAIRDIIAPDRDLGHSDR